MATTTPPELIDRRPRPHRQHQQSDLATVTDPPGPSGLVRVLGAVLVGAVLAGVVLVGAVHGFATDEHSSGWAPDRAAGPGTAASREASVAGPTGGSATTSAGPIRWMAAPAMPVRQPASSATLRAVRATPTASPTSAPAT